MKGRRRLRHSAARTPAFARSGLSAEESIRSWGEVVRDMGCVAVLRRGGKRPLSDDVGIVKYRDKVRYWRANRRR